MKDIFHMTRGQRNDELSYRRENARRIYCQNHGQKYLSPAQRAEAKR